MPSRRLLWSRRPSRLVQLPQRKGRSFGAALFSYMMEAETKGVPVAGISKEEYAAEERFLKGLPRFNLGAFLLPPIWGPAHGIWVTILFYPAWLVADNAFYAAYSDPTPLAVTLAAIIGVLLVGVTVAFAIVAQPYAAHRAERLGVSRSAYLRRERWWAVGCAVGAVAMLAFATWYNLALRGSVAGA